MPATCNRNTILLSADRGFAPPPSPLPVLPRIAPCTASSYCLLYRTILYCLQDVYSLGLTLAELFLDGRSVMDLGGALGYKRREWDPAATVCTLFVFF